MGDLIDASAGFRINGIKMRELPVDNEENVISWEEALQQMEKKDPSSNYFKGLEQLVGTGDSSEMTMSWWSESFVSLLENPYDNSMNGMRENSVHAAVHMIGGQENLITARDMLFAINNPYLVADVIINLDPKLVKRLHEIEDDPLITGTFWQYIAVMDSTQPDERKRKELHSNPELLDQMLGAIATNIVYDLQHCVYKTNEKKLLESLADHLNTYEPVFHEGIVQKIAERNWVRLDRDSAIRMKYLAIKVESLYKKAESERL
jgi:hypothetical protein